LACLGGLEGLDGLVELVFVELGHLLLGLDAVEIVEQLVDDGLRDPLGSVHGGLPVQRRLAAVARAVAARLGAL